MRFECCVVLLSLFYQYWFQYTNAHQHKNLKDDDVAFRIHLRRAMWLLWLILLPVGFVVSDLCNCYCPHYVGVAISYACNTPICTDICRASELGNCRGAASVTG